MSFLSLYLFARAEEIQKTKTFIWLSGWKNEVKEADNPKIGPQIYISSLLMVVSKLLHDYTYPYRKTTLAIFVSWDRGHDFQGWTKCTVGIIQTADEHRSQTQIFHVQRDASCGRCFSRTGSTGRASLVWSLYALDTRLRLRDHLEHLVWLFQA